MKKGDVVKVIDDGLSYDMHEDMAKRLNSTNWEKGKSNPRNGAVGIVNDLGYSGSSKAIIALVEIYNKEYEYVLADFLITLNAQ